MIAESILGMAIGGIFRIAPEILSFFDRKNERAHELSMLDKNLEYDAARSTWELQQIETHGQMVLDGAGMEALVTSIRAQGQPTGIGWVDALSASVRPVLTYWWALGLYTAVLVCRYMLLIDNDITTTEAISLLWGTNEQALVSSIFTFWFLDRVLKKRPIS